MRKITQEAVNAFYNGGTFSRDNTQVYINDAGENCLKLYKTVIARIQWDGKLWLNTDGWITNTTRERLNGVLLSRGVYIMQKKFKWYLVTSQETIDFVDGMTIPVN